MIRLTVTRLPAFLFTVICLIASCAAAAELRTSHIVILHVNDVHGQTLGSSEGGTPSGGYARLSSAVEKIREEVGRENVILVHAGDEFSRGDAMTMTSLGASSIALMNQIGFSLMTPGNGDFYSGAANLQKRIGEAKFPVLATNVSYRFDGQPLAERTQIIQAGGVRLGFLGLCFLRKEHPSSLPLKVQEPIETARQVVPQLRQKSDVVIALDHIGFAEDRRLAAEVAGIDVIIGGHSHTTLPRGSWAPAPEDRSVLIAQAGEYLRYVGRVDLELSDDGHGWTLSDASAQLVPLDGSVAEDPAIKAAIARLWPTTAPVAPPQPVPAGAD